VLEQVLGSYGPFADNRRALELVTQMAEEGDLNRIRDLALYHREGRFGLRKDPAKAVAQLQRGLALDPAKLSPAQVEQQALLKDDLGIAYIRGDGVARDAARGAQLLRESGVEGFVDEEGDISRGWFYTTGEHGFPRNLQKARALLVDRFSPDKGSRSEKDYAAALAALAAAEASAEKPAAP
jgi:TPR repeat protein